VKWERERERERERANPYKHRVTTTTTTTTTQLTVSHHLKMSSGAAAAAGDAPMVDANTLNFMIALGEHALSAQSTPSHLHFLLCYSMAETLATPAGG